MSNRLVSSNLVSSHFISPHLVSRVTLAAAAGMGMGMRAWNVTGHKVRG